LNAKIYHFLVLIYNQFRFYESKPTLTPVYHVFT
jgi:hypothetical protein